MPAADSRSRSSSPYAVEQVAVKLNRSALGACWRWRSEAGYLAGGVSGFLGCWHCVGPDVTGAAFGLSAAVAVSLPWPRRFLAARLWAPWAEGVD